MSPIAGDLDPDINAFNVTDSPLHECLDWALKGTLPRHLFPAVLHEATHHWCLSGCVGLALAQLSFETQVIFAEAVDPPLELDKTTEVQRDAVQFTRRLLEPLLEGMAMFAEFDVYPGSSASLSGVLGMIARLFARSSGNGPDTLLDSLHLSLMEYRLSESALRRKSDMLVHDLNSSAGGYLMGYLSVKNLWHRARKVSHRMRDADLFLQYLRNLIFDDAGFVELLILATIPTAETPNAFFNLVHYLHARLNLMAAVDLDIRAAQMEKALLSHNHLKGNWSCIHLSEELVDDVNEKLRQRCLAIAPELKSMPLNLSKSMTRREQLDAIFTFAQTLTPEVLGLEKVDPKKLWRMSRNSAYLMHRSLVRIQMYDVQYQLNEGGECVLFSQGQQEIAIAIPTERTVGSKGIGKLVLYYLPDDFDLALICFDNQGPVFSVFGSNVSASAQHGLLAVIRLVNSEQELRDSLANFLHLYNVLRPPSVPEALSTLWIETVYLDNSLSFVDDAHLKHCEQSLRAGGLWQFLDEDGENVNSLALLGLVQSFTSNEALARETLQSHGFDLNRVLAMLHRVQKAHGLPLINEGSRTPFI